MFRINAGTQKKKIETKESSNFLLLNMRSVVCIMLLLLLTALNALESRAFSVKTSTVRSNNTKAENGNGLTTIDVNKISLQEFCVFANISDIECTCEKVPFFCLEARIFTCTRYWDRVEGIFKVTVSAIGVLGNAAVVLIALKTWKSSGRFNKLVALLALGDLIFAVAEIVTATPLLWTCKWEYKTFLCKFLKGSVNAGAIFALCMITIIALERYLAIVKPFSRSRLKFELPFWVWPLLATLFSTASTIPVLFVFKVTEDGICVEHWTEGSKGSLIYSWYLLIGTFVIPMGIISYFYYCIITKVRENKFSLQRTVNNSVILQQRNQTNRRVMYILVAIAIAFFALVFPNRIIWVVLDITGTKNMPYSTFLVWKYIALFPYLLHVSVNPLIYSFIDKRFQREILGLLRVKRKSRSFGKATSSTESNEQIVRGTIVNSKALSKESVL